MPVPLFTNQLITAILQMKKIFTYLAASRFYIEQVHHDSQKHLGYDVQTNGIQYVEGI